MSMQYICTHCMWTSSNISFLYHAKMVPKASCSPHGVLDIGAPLVSIRKIIMYLDHHAFTTITLICTRHNVPGITHVPLLHSHEQNTVPVVSYSIPYDYTTGSCLWYYILACMQPDKKTFHGTQQPTSSAEQQAFEAGPLVSNSIL